MTCEDAIKTIKTAIAEVEWNYPMDYAVAFEKAIDALKNEDRFRWHDLRKDPNDLPNDDSIEYVVCVEYRNGKRECTVGCLDMSGDMMLLPTLGNWIGNSYHIIAWREIEPFEEVDE